MEADLKIIGRYLEAKLGNNLVALILFGGFGRGEGTVINKTADNDYDLCLVVSKKIDRAILTKWGSTLAKKVRTRFVDLILIRRKDLPHLPVNQFYYDIKYGSKVIFGPKDILEEFPAYPAGILPLSAAETILLNRTLSLLECFQKDEVLQKSQIGRVLFACCDYYLIAQKQYRVKYADKFETFRRLYPEKGQLSWLLARSLDYKLRRKDFHLKTEDWFVARDILLSSLEECLTRTKCFPGSNWIASIRNPSAAKRKAWQGKLVELLKSVKRDGGNSHEKIRRAVNFSYKLLHR